MNKLPLVAAAALALCSAPTAQVAPAPQAFTLEQVLDYPFADNLVAAPKGQGVAWTFNERGLRNIYAAEGPAFEARRLTPYQNDDGQELTNLAFSADAGVVDRHERRRTEAGRGGRHAGHLARGRSSGVRPRSPDLYRPGRWLEAGGAGVLRARHQRISGGVARRPVARV